MCTGLITALKEVTIKSTGFARLTKPRSVIGLLVGGNGSYDPPLGFHFPQEFLVFVPAPLKAPNGTGLALGRALEL